MREGRKGLVNVYTPAQILAKGVRMQLGHIITQISAHPCERVSERASWLVPTTTMESAIDSAVSKVALETFEAEAREVIAAFVCGNNVFVSLQTG